MSDGQQTYNASIYKVDGAKASEIFFKFVADNSNVEWGLNEFADAHNYVSTGHWPTSEVGAYALFNQSSMNFSGRQLIRSDHSHPGGIHSPSGQGTQGGDKNWAWGLQNRFQNKIRFDIYTPSDGISTPYKPGHNEPISLDEIKITPSSK